MAKVDGRKNRKKIKKPLKPSQRKKLSKAMEGNKNAVGNKGGVDSIYEPWMGKVVYESHLLMRTVTEICEILGIARDTYYTWQKEIPEFADKIFQGTHGIDNKIVKKLAMRAAGFKMRVQKPIKIKNDKSGADEIVNHTYVEYHAPDTRAIEIWLRNRDNAKKKWSNLPAEDTPPPPPIVHNNMIDLSQLDDATIRKIIAAIKPGKS